MVRECATCDGTGYVEAGQWPCSTCRGTGILDSRPSFCLADPEDEGDRCDYPNCYCG